MTIIQQKRLVGYRCSQMYALVNDVEKYADFLPFCAESIVHYRDDDELQATLVVSVSGMRQSFTTRNLLQKDKMIEVRLVGDTFSRLEGFWRFDEQEDGQCLISFDLEIQFNSKMMGFIFNSVLEQIMNQLLDAFCHRAKVLYGDASIVSV